MLLTMLRDGRLHLSGIVRLVPHLTVENRQAVLERAAHKSKRQIEELVAELEPKPNARAAIRKLPERRAMMRPASSPDAGSASAGSGCALDSASTLESESNLGSGSTSGGSKGAEVRPDAAPFSGDLTALSADVGPNPQLCPGRVGSSAKPAAAASKHAEPLSPGRYKVQFTADAEFKNELERLQALTRTAVPDGDLGNVIRLAVTRELARLEARRFAKTKKPRKRLAQTDTRPTSRYISAPVRRFVEKRDGGRCTFRDRRGRRCTKRDDLEFHHRIPFGLGGDHRPERLALICRTHNLLLAEEDYGKEKIARYRHRANGAPDPPAALPSLAWEKRDRATPGAGSPSGPTIHPPPR